MNRQIDYFIKNTEMDGHYKNSELMFQQIFLKNCKGFFLLMSNIINE